MQDPRLRARGFSILFQYHFQLQPAMGLVGLRRCGAIDAEIYRKIKDGRRQ